MKTIDQNDLDHPRQRAYNGRLRRDLDDEVEYRHRHSSGLLAACLVLALAVAGLAWYSYPRFREQSASLSQTRQDLGDRWSGFGQKTRQSFRDAYYRTEAKLSAAIHSGKQSSDALQDRVSNLEASRAADQSQIAALNQEVTEMRPQTIAQAAAADQSADQSNANAAEISPTVDKVDFQANKDQQSELSGGITLFVSGTDMTRRTVNGWMWLANEHRRIQLHQQNALDPVIFYGAGDGQKRELVITGVDKDSVTGYLLLPKQSNSASLGQAGAGAE